MRADSQNNICEVLAITTVLIALSSAFYLLVSQKALQDLRNIAPTSIFNIRPPPQESSSNGLTVKEFFPVRSANENASVYEEELLSLTNGFLMVQESEGLPRQYGVSMFHQLHCVAMVRAKLFGSDMHHHSHHPESTAGVEVGGTAQMENKDQDREEMEHLAHCLDYFAQGIMCTADDTIEAPQKILYDDQGKQTRIISGKGMVHQCRDARNMLEVVVKSEQVPVKAWHWKNGDTLTGLGILG